MSFSRKVRRNIRNQQRKAIGKYLQMRARELNAQRRVEVQQGGPVTGKYASTPFVAQTKTKRSRKAKTKAVTA